MPTTSSPEPTAPKSTPAAKVAHKPKTYGDIAVENAIAEELAQTYRPSRLHLNGAGPHNSAYLSDLPAAIIDDAPRRRRFPSDALRWMQAHWRRAWQGMAHQVAGWQMAKRLPWVRRQGMKPPIAAPSAVPAESAKPKALAAGRTIAALPDHPLVPVAVRFLRQLGLPVRKDNEILDFLQAMVWAPEVQAEMASGEAEDLGGELTLTTERTLREALDPEYLPLEDIQLSETPEDAAVFILYELKNKAIG